MLKEDGLRVTNAVHTFARAVDDFILLLEAWSDGKQPADDLTVGELYERVLSQLLNAQGCCLQLIRRVRALKEMQHASNDTRAVLHDGDGTHDGPAAHRQPVRSGQAEEACRGSHAPEAHPGDEPGPSETEKGR